MTRQDRPSIPLGVQLKAALIQLGLDPATAELDHNPALSRRKRTADGGYDPPANDPRHLQWMAPGPHKNKTFGPGGERRIHTRGSDIGELAHERRLTKQQQAFRDRLTAKESGAERPSSKWPKRKMQGRSSFQNRRAAS